MLHDFLPITKSILFGRLSPICLFERKDSEFQFVLYWNKAKKILDCQSVNEIDKTICDILSVSYEYEDKSENIEHQMDDDIIPVLEELRGEYTPLFIIEHIPWCGFTCPSDTTKEMFFYDIMTQLENKRAILWLKETERSLMSNELTFEKVAACLMQIYSYIMQIRDNRKGKTDEVNKTFDMVTSRLFDLYMTILLMCRLDDEHTNRLHTKNLPTGYYEMYEFAYNDMPADEHVRAWRRGSFLMYAHVCMDDRAFNENNAKHLLGEAVGITGTNEVDIIVEKCEMFLFYKANIITQEKCTDNPGEEIYKAITKNVNGKSDPRDIISFLENLDNKVKKCQIKDDNYKAGTLNWLRNKIQTLIGRYYENLGDSFVPRKDISRNSPNPIHKNNTKDIKNKAIKELEFLKGTPKDSRSIIMDARNHKLLVDAVVNFIDTEDVNPDIDGEIHIEMNQQDLRYTMYLVWDRAIKGADIKNENYKRFVYNLFRHKFKNTVFTTIAKKFSTKPQNYDKKYGR